MKSVIAESSTIAKAIEIGWQKAGCPLEFTVKIFQEPQRNMFGLTKSSAQIGIFFDESPTNQKSKPNQNVPVSKVDTQANPKRQAPRSNPANPAKVERKAGPAPVVANQDEIKAQVEAIAVQPTEQPVGVDPNNGASGQARKRRRRRFRKRSAKAAPSTPTALAEPVDDKAQKL